MAKRKRQTQEHFADPVETDVGVHVRRNPRSPEVIKAIKWTGRKYQYLVQWAGYPGEDTWEPFITICRCCRLLTSMWHMLGNVRRVKGTIFRLPQQWIDSEIDYFHRSYGDDLELCIPMRPSKRTGGTKKKRQRVITSDCWGDRSDCDEIA